MTRRPPRTNSTDQFFPYTPLFRSESDPGSWRSGFTNQTHYLAERGGFDYWSHQPNRRVGNVASSANGLLRQLEPLEVTDHTLPGRSSGRAVLLARLGEGGEGLASAMYPPSPAPQSRREHLDFLPDWKCIVLG